MSGIQRQRLRKHPGEGSTMMSRHLWNSESRAYSSEGDGTKVSEFRKCYAFGPVKGMSKEKTSLCELIFVLPRKIGNKWLSMIGNQYYLESLKKVPKSLQNSRWFWNWKLNTTFFYETYFLFLYLAQISLVIINILLEETINFKGQSIHFNWDYYWYILHILQT